MPCSAKGESSTRGFRVREKTHAPGSNSTVREVIRVLALLIPGSLGIGILLLARTLYEATAAFLVAVPVSAGVVLTYLDLRHSGMPITQVTISDDSVTLRDSDHFGVLWHKEPTVRFDQMVSIRRTKYAWDRHQNSPVEKIVIVGRDGSQYVGSRVNQAAADDVALKARQASKDCQVLHFDGSARATRTAGGAAPATQLFDSSSYLPVALDTRLRSRLGLTLSVCMGFLVALVLSNGIGTPVQVMRAIVAFGLSSIGAMMFIGARGSGRDLVPRLRLDHDTMFLEYPGLVFPLAKIRRFPRGQIRGLRLWRDSETDRAVGLTILLVDGSERTIGPYAEPMLRDFCAVVTEKWGVERILGRKFGETQERSRTSPSSRS